MVKNLFAIQETQKTWVQSAGREDPLEKKWQPTPVFLPGESHGQRSLAVYSPKGYKELNMTEQLNTHAVNSFLQLTAFCIKYMCLQTVS